MGKSRWSIPTWIFLHTLVAKINPIHFSKVKIPIWNLISNIVSILPCPSCSEHSREFLKKVNIKKINSKKELEDVIFYFHNNAVINSGKKPYFKKEDLSKYYRFNLPSCYNNFAREYTRPTRNMRTLGEELARKNIIKNIHKSIFPIKKYLLT
tara:strand:- start:924 stop:1382 length:459 start_codon:yes stop_codon:yes gene_type:complete